MSIPKIPEADRLVWLIGAVARGRAFILDGFRGAVDSVGLRSVGGEQIATSTAVELHDLAAAFTQEWQDRERAGAVQTALATGLIAYNETEPLFRYVWYWGVPLKDAANTAAPARAHRYDPMKRDFASQFDPEEYTLDELVALIAKCDQASNKLRLIPFASPSDFAGTDFFFPRDEAMLETMRGDNDDQLPTDS